MKSKIIKTVLWIFALIISAKIISFIKYMVTAQVASQIAPSQLDDDAGAYALIHTTPIITDIINLIYVIVVIAIVVMIYKVWKKKDKVSEPSKEN